MQRFCACSLLYDIFSSCSCKGALASVGDIKLRQDVLEEITHHRWDTARRLLTKIWSGMLDTVHLNFSLSLLCCRSIDLSGTGLATPRHSHARSAVMQPQKY